MTKIIWLLGFLTVLAGSALAQNAELSGKVTDPTNAAVPGVTITITKSNTGEKQRIVTNDSGIYVLPQLVPGTYEVQAQKDGFQTLLRRDFLLHADDRLQLDFSLQVGGIAQEVTVTGGTESLETVSATLSNVRTQQAVQDLPLNGRNFAQLIQLAPGSVPTVTQQGGVPPATEMRGVTNNAVNGARPEDNNFMVDGININDNHNGEGLVMYPPLDAIQEFRVETSDADAQYGRGGGGTINLIYKSGGSEFHGGLFEFLRNANLDAKNFFDVLPGGTPPYKQNQFGGFLGGPMPFHRHDPKTFFFVNYEGLQIRQAQTYTDTVPTIAERSGNFSAFKQAIYSPLTQTQTATGAYQRSQFPDNIIPASQIDPVGANILNLYPLPNEPGTTNNYVYNPVKQVGINRGDAKVDHTISNADTVFARYSIETANFVNPGTMPAPAAGSGDRTSEPAQQAVLGETHVFCANKVNEFRLGWTRNVITSLNWDYGQNLAQSAGIPGANAPGDSYSTGLPIFSITGLTTLGDNAQRPLLAVSDNIETRDDFSYVKGKHTIKVGGSFTRLRYNTLQANAERGSMTFSTIYSSDPASPIGTGIGAADVLLGRAASGYLQTLSGDVGLRRSEIGLYTQDAIKVTDKFTLTLGLRYENYLGWPWTEVANRMYQFVPATDSLVQVGQNPVPWRSGIKPDNNNFAPRVGIAYRITPKTVFRAGYGIFYSDAPLAITYNLAVNPPALLSSAYSNNQYNFLGATPASAGFVRPAQGVILSGSVLNALDPNARTPYTQQWNATVQQQLPLAFSLSASYVGTVGHKLPGQSNVNQAVPGTTAIAAREPYPNFNTINDLQDRYDSNYNALQVVAERRFAHNLGFQLSYTWSHSIDDLTNWEGSGVMDIYNIRLDRGNSSFNVPQFLALSGTYALPLHAKGVWNYIAGGWQMNGILSVYSGLPFSVGSATNTLNIGSSTRANRICNGTLPADQRSVGEWFNTSCWSTPGFEQFGNAGRDILQGPPTRELDFSIFKNFNLNENGERKLQFRAESFNLTNTPQFNNPASTFGAAGFGTISSAGSPVTLQRTPRQVQLALRLYF